MPPNPAPTIAVRHSPAHGHSRYSQPVDKDSVGVLHLSLNSIANVFPESQCENAYLSHGGLIVSGLMIDQRSEGIGGKPYARTHRDAPGHPVRLSLVTWQTLGFLGATIATAACLLGECPFSEKDRPRSTFVDHVGAVMSVAYAPDGSRLATVGGDGSVVIRDPSAARGYPLQPSGSDPVRCVAFSPDGKAVATGSRNELVALHDLEKTCAAVPRRRGCRDRRGRGPGVRARRRHSGGRSTGWADHVLGRGHGTDAVDAGGA